MSDMKPLNPHLCPARLWSGEQCARMLGWQTSHFGIGYCNTHDCQSGRYGRRPLPEIVERLHPGPCDDHGFAGWSSCHICGRAAEFRVVPKNDPRGVGVMTDRDPHTAARLTVNLNANAVKAMDLAAALTGDNKTCPHPDWSFDRTICGGCDSMPDVCVECGWHDCPPTAAPGRDGSRPTP